MDHRAPPLLAVASAAGLLLACATGCLAYNEDCSPLVERPDEITGWLGGDVNNAKSVVRASDNAFGQLVAEAYYHAFDDSKESLRPDLAIENSGDIRSEGVCVSREVVKKGAVRRSVLREVLPFDNGIVVVSVTHRQLKNVLEHSVAKMTTDGSANPSAAFLQLYGVTVAADCSRAAEKLDASGARASEGQRITGITVRRRDGTDFAVPIDPPSDTEKIRVALSSYIAAAGDNYVDFKSVDLNSPDSLSAGSYDFEIIAGRFRTAYPESSPLPSPPPPRWNFNCR